MKKHALLIGVEDYRDESISPLNYACSDAKALGADLSDKCGFDNVRVLASKEGDDEPTLVNIINALQDVTVELSEDDLFLFFFAGHGIEKSENAYLLASDSVAAFPDHASLSLDLLRKNFESLSAGKRVVLLDACRNNPEAGRGDTDNCLSDVISRDIVAAARSTRLKTSTTVLLSACSSGQRAYEWKAKKHGVFTHYLLEGLRGKAWSEDTLYFEDLASYATERVKNWSKNSTSIACEQEPWYEKFGDPSPIILGNVQDNKQVQLPLVTSQVNHELSNGKTSEKKPVENTDIFIFGCSTFENLGCKPEIIKLFVLPNEAKYKIRFNYELLSKKTAINPITPGKHKITIIPKTFEYGIRNVKVRVCKGEANTKCIKLRRMFQLKNILCFLFSIIYGLMIGGGFWYLPFEPWSSWAGEGIAGGTVSVVLGGSAFVILYTYVLVGISRGACGLDYRIPIYNPPSFRIFCVWMPTLLFYIAASLVAIQVEPKWTYSFMAPAISVIVGLNLFLIPWSSGCYCKRPYLND